MTDCSEIPLVLATHPSAPHPHQPLHFIYIAPGLYLPAWWTSTPASDEETAAVQRLFNHLSQLYKVKPHLPSPSLSHTHAYTHTGHILVVPLL